MGMACRNNSLSQGGGQAGKYLGPLPFGQQSKAPTAETP